MKLKKVKAMLSLSLAVTLAFGQAGAVYAAEAADVVTSEEAAPEAADEEEKAAPEAPAQDSTEADKEEETSEGTEEGENIAPENEAENPGAPADGSGEAVQAPEEGDGTASAEEGENPAAPEEGGAAETADGDEKQDPSAGEEPQDAGDISAMAVGKQKKLDALGFKTMRLDQEMVEEKAELAKIVSELAAMEPGEDYAENSIIYAAETAELAAEIAGCYGGTLTGYGYGIAEASIGQDVAEAIEVAADAEISIPAVYPNLKIQLDDGNILQPQESEGPADAQESEFADAEDVEHTADLDTVQDEDEAAMEAYFAGEQPYAANPSDPYYYTQWWHEAVHTTDAWDVTKGKGVTVAVLDTGVDYNHPDLKDNIVGHVSMVNDGSQGMDVNGHGTHCAGIIAAEAGNNEGGAGIAPEAGIYAVKVMGDNGSGYILHSIMGVLEATEKNVNVISMSLGGFAHLPLFQEAIDEAVKKGIIVVAAAGNESTSQKSYPAAYNNVISVAAVMNNYSYYSLLYDYNNLSSFTNFGSWVDVAAPGYMMLSTVPLDYKDYSPYSPAAGYDQMSGTSMACPLVAGTMALMVSNSKSAGESDVNRLSKALEDSAYEKSQAFNGHIVGPEGEVKQTGNYPLVDAESAVYAAAGNAPQAPALSFGDGTSSTASEVAAGDDKYFSFSSNGKIFYTINGKKPTVKNGIPYQKGSLIRMNRSGKVKIQAITMIGNTPSPVFSQTYQFVAPVTSLYPTCGEPDAKYEVYSMDVLVGKSIQLGVSISPSYASNQKLTWTCESASGHISVNKKGKVTCNKKASAGDTAVVTVKTNDGTDIERTFKITAVTDKVSGLKLNATSLKMSRWIDEMAARGKQSEGYVDEFQLKPDSGNVTDQFTYKSSNTKVATVSRDGLIRAQGKGTAKITVTTNDGSNKKATCKVTVKNPVFDIWTISSTGYVPENSDGSPAAIPIATGCSIKMKTELNYNYKDIYNGPSSKALKWESSNRSAVKVSNGKITCAANATAGTIVKVTATAKDDWGVSQDMYFRVYDKVTRIDWQGRENVIPVFNQTTDPYTGEIRDLMVGDVLDDPIFSCRMYGNKQGGVACGEFSTKNSKPDVAYRYYYVDYNNPANSGWVVQATKKGTCMITYTMRDGSNTKFTMGFKVSDVDWQKYPL